MKEILLTQGKLAKVDDKYYNQINQFEWRYDLGYGIRQIQTNLKRKSIAIHQLVIELSRQIVPLGFEIDHIDRDKLNDQECNLRIVTPGQNRYNTDLRADNSSGHKGISYDKSREKWVASIWINKYRHSSRHHTIEEAIAARENMEIYYGVSEFCRSS